MLAKYDFGFPTHPPTFDFFTWLVIVQRMGASKIALANIHTPHPKFEGQREKIDSIIKPGIAFSGLPWKEANKGDMIYSCIHMTGVPDDFQRLKSVLPPRKIDYTVTLRTQKKRIARNSNEDVWREFAARIGALVIEDYNVTPIDLHERMALYAGAKMNFGVCGGPLMMLYYTDYPVMMVNCANPLNRWREHGIDYGDQLRWARPNQILSWDDDVTLNDLMEKFECIKSTNINSCNIPAN